MDRLPGDVAALRPGEKRTIAAISSGRPWRPSGMLRDSARPCGPPAEAPRTVSIEPGATALAVMLCGASSIAMPRSKALEPGFRGVDMHPAGRAGMVRDARKADQRAAAALDHFRHRRLCQDEGAVERDREDLVPLRRGSSRRNGVCRRSPALPTAMSTPPNSLTAASTIAATASGFEMSAMNGRARPPACGFRLRSPRQSRGRRGR